MSRPLRIEVTRLLKWRRDTLSLSISILLIQTAAFWGYQWPRSLSLACTCAYVRTILIGADLRESTAVRGCDFSNKCSFAAVIAPVYDYDPIRYLGLNYQGDCPRESCSSSFSFSARSSPIKVKRSRRHLGQAYKKKRETSPNDLSGIFTSKFAKKK